MARRISGTEECPDCGALAYSYDRSRNTNHCYRCGHEESVELPQMMTKWDIKDIVIDLIDNDADVGDAITRFLDRGIAKAMAELEAEKELGTEDLD